MFIIVLTTAFHLIFLSWLRQSLDNKHILSPADFSRVHDACIHQEVCSLVASSCWPSAVFSPSEIIREISHGFEASKDRVKTQPHLYLYYQAFWCPNLYTIYTIYISWVRFPPRSKDFFFASCGSLFPFTRANAQWVIHGFK